MTPDAETFIRPTCELDIRGALSVLRHGAQDPTVHLGLASATFAHHSPCGPVTVRVQRKNDFVHFQAWGPGAEYATTSAAAIVGNLDDLSDWRPDLHPLVHAIHRKHKGLKFIATNRVMDAIVPAVLEQKVTSIEAHRSWSRMVRAFNQVAPGPFALKLPPTPEFFARLPYHEMHRFGVERRRADVIRHLASRAFRVEEASVLEGNHRRARLEAFVGVGVWTSAETAQVAWGDADAVSVGDYHLASVVVHALTGQRGGDDDGMLELLEPFRPHRGRAARLLMMSGLGPAARGPKHRIRDIRAI